MFPFLCSWSSGAPTGSLVTPTGSLVEPTQHPSSSTQPLTSPNERSTLRKLFHSRIFLNIEQKRKIVKEVSQGMPTMEVAKRYGIGKTQVYKVWKQRNVLESDKGVSVPNYSKITSIKSMYPMIDITGYVQLGKL